MMKKMTVLYIVLILFVGSFLSIYFTFKKELGVANNRLRSLSTSVFSSSIGDIEYRLEGEGPCIVISHGVTGGIDQGIGLKEMYVGNGYQYLYISRFGYLKSSMPEKPSAKLQAQAYSELLDHLGIKFVYILGNSAGGPSATYFAIHYPEKCKALILVSSAVPDGKAEGKVSAPPDIVFKSDFIYWIATKTAGKSLMKMFVPESIQKKMTKQELKKIANSVFASVLPVSKRSSGIIFDTNVSNPSVNMIPFEQVKPPTLIIHAVDDPAPPYKGAKEIASRISGAKLVSIKDGGHLLLGHEDEVKKEIYSFFMEQEAK
jgi:pimeloyl-ACP methyl ester carboxylesterase